jgi:hypothetical protein
MTRTSAAIAYDSAGNAALSIASRDSDGNDGLIDTGTTSCPANELAEWEATLRANGFLVVATEYADSLDTHSQADAVTELNDIQPRILVNDSIFAVSHTNQPVGPTTSRNANVIRAPTVVQA